MGKELTQKSTSDCHGTLAPRMKTLPPQCSSRPEGPWFPILFLYPVMSTPITMPKMRGHCYRCSGKYFATDNQIWFLTIILRFHGWQKCCWLRLIPNSHYIFSQLPTKIVNRQKILGRDMFSSKLMINIQMGKIT